MDLTDQSNSIDITLYREFSSQVANVYSRIAKEKLHTPITEGKWTPFQILQHITDSEIVYFRRIKRALTEENPNFLGWHPTEWIEMEASDFEIELNIDIIRGIRNKIYFLLHKIDTVSWNRHVTHPRYGLMTLEDLILQQIKHESHHLDTVQNLF